MYIKLKIDNVVLYIVLLVIFSTVALIAGNSRLASYPIIVLVGLALILFTGSYD